MENNQSQKMLNVQWTEHKINTQMPDPCDHYFEFTADGCRCKKCQMGLIGVYEIKDGKPLI